MESKGVRKPKAASSCLETAKKRHIGWIVAVMAAALVLAFVLFRAATTVTVLGERYSVTQTRLELDGDGVILTQGDLKALRRMDQLGYLSIQNVTVEGSFAPFDGEMERLYSLSLKNCNGLTDLAFLDHAEGIAVLELNNCGITDEMLANSVIEQLSLRELTLDNNKQITDLPLGRSSEEWLNTLHISHTGITDMTVLSSYTALSELYAEGLGLTQLPYLRNDMKVLYVSDNALTTLQGLEGSTELRELYAANNRLGSIEALSGCKALQVVDLSSNMLTDLTALEKSCETLREVNVNNNRLTSVRVFENCGELYKLQLNHNAVSQMTLTNQNRSLAIVSAQGNGMTELRFDQFSGAFKVLNVSDNRLTAADFSNVHFENRAMVNLSRNRIQSLSLEKDIELNWLLLQDNPLEADAGQIGHGRKIALPYHEKLDVTALADAYQMYYLVGCPADRQSAVETILGPCVTFATNEECNEAYVADCA